MLIVRNTLSSIVVMLCLLAYISCVRAAPLAGHATVFVYVDISPNAITKPVNRRLLGNNIEWTQRGDGLLLPNSLTLEPNLLSRLTELAPTVIRYPGGSQADLFHWQMAMGTLSERGMVENFFTGLLEPADFGPAEFLQLCQLTGATPLITANVVTGDAMEAAAWLAATNVDRITSPTGNVLPIVPLWEIGNEPYLTDDRPDLAISASEFATRVNSFVPAMRAVDSSIMIGVPLAGDRLSQFLPAPNNVFNETVLAALTVQPDYFAIHNAYLPFYYGTLPTINDVYLQTVAGAWLVNQDLDAVRSQVDAHFPGLSIPFGLTEHNALFTLNSSPTDEYVASFASAMYVADLLIMLAQRNDILTADFWSLLDNAFFGTIDGAGRNRPIFAVLSVFSQMWLGDVLPTQVTGPTFNVPAATGVGLFPGAIDLPTVTALTLRNADAIRMILINKDPTLPMTVQIQLSDPVQITNLTSREYYRNDVFETFMIGDNTLNWQPASVSQVSGNVIVTLKEHSIRTVEFSVQTPTVAVPTVTHWGLLLLVLLVVTCSTIILSRRRGYVYI